MWAYELQQQGMPSGEETDEPEPIINLTVTDVQETYRFLENVLRDGRAKGATTTSPSLNRRRTA